MGRNAEDILLEIAQLLARLDEAEQLLRTLGPGLADLPVPYASVQIPEEAAVLTGTGRILRCGNRFARMLQTPPSRLLGSTLYQHVAGDNETALASILETGAQDRTSGEIRLTNANGRARKVHIAVEPAALEGIPGACLVRIRPAQSQREKSLREADRQPVHSPATIAEHEQERIGRDLKDVLGQTLAAIALLGKTLHRRLEALGHPDVPEVGQIIGLVSQGLKQLRSLAESLQTVEPQPDGLRKALGEYAADVENLHGVGCRFEWDGHVRVDNREVATHLYHIAQEAVSNAVRHGRATRISIRLARAGGNGRFELDITSNGIDFPAQTTKRGLGLHIMNQRADAIGASLSIRRGPAGGARVTCSVPGSMGVAEVQSGYDNATGSDR